MGRRRIITMTAAIGGVAAAAGAVALYGGWYDVTATDQHLRPTYWLLDTGMRESLERRARGVQVPPLDDPALVVRGLAHFRAHCVQCHGAPGVAPSAFALGLTPLPENLVHVARIRRPAEIFQAVKYGLKMTGMPAWEFRLPDDDLWAVVAFVRQLPTLSPAQYAKLPASAPPSVPREGLPMVADPVRGKTAILQYACVTCHVVPGVVGANAPVGPPLDRMAQRTYLAGRLLNTEENLVRWIREPKAISPHSAMPDLGVTERDARDMAAYLRALR
jgi:mono/diheme cytochrome c family protein